MQPTGSRTTDRFNAQWGSTDLPTHSLRWFVRSVSTLIAGVLLIPSFVLAQGPIQPASYGYSPGAMYGGPPFQVCGPGCPPGGAAPLSPNTVYELLPDDRFSHGDELQLAAFSDAFKHAYIRLEYLNWDIEDPGLKNVGAPRADGNTRGIFTATEPGTLSNVGEANISTLDHIGLHNNNGIRGVFGLPTRIGLFEAGVSVLEDASSHEVDVPFFNAVTLEPVIPAVTLLENGVPSDTNMILFRDGMINTRVQAEFFTTELNYIMNPVTPNQPITIRPLFGFQYVRLWDFLDVRGT
ncbi:MAG: hypothetical protein KDA85_19415, partial [Planctomycetaceae bacterium]|nr:hypothetical protein [Planctomycetaceae bacterium]